MRSPVVTATALVLAEAAAASGSARAAALALLTAASACELGLRSELSKPQVDRLMSLIDDAGELLKAQVDPLDLAYPRGSA